MANIPKRITGANLYLEGAVVAALASVDLPDVNFGEIEHNTMGLGGTIVDYNPFDLQSMTGTINATGPNTVLRKALDPVNKYVIESRSNFSGMDALENGGLNEGESISMEVKFGGISFGSRANNEGGEQGVTYSCLNLTYSVDGEEIAHIDPAAGVVRINGEDITADIRGNL